LDEKGLESLKEEEGCLKYLPWGIFPSSFFSLLKEFYDEYLWKSFII